MGNKTKSSLIDKVLQNQHEKAWATKTRKLKEELNIDTNTDPALSSNTIKKKIKEATNINFHCNITKTAKEKSKTQHLLEGIGNWSPGKRPTYISKLNREQASTIFKARTRMLPVKNNYRGQYKDNICRGCKAEIETQQHVLENCQNIHKNNEIKVPSSQYFTEDIHTLKRA